LPERNTMRVQKESRSSKNKSTTLTFSKEVKDKGFAPLIKAYSQNELK